MGTMFLGVYKIFNTRKSIEQLLLTFNVMGFFIFDGHGCFFNEVLFGAGMNKSAPFSASLAFPIFLILYHYFKHISLW